MNRQGGVCFRDLEEPRQGQGGMYSIVYLGNCTSFMLLGFDGRGLTRIWGWEPDHREPGVHAATLKLQLVYLGSDCSVSKQKSARFSILERTHWW